MSYTQKTDVPIEKTLSRNLKRVYNRMHVDTNKLFKTLKITVAQFDLMETILLSQNQALSIQDLASRTVSLQPNITRMVAELESAGLVERSSGSDRRIVIVQATQKGEQLVDKIQKPLLDLHVSQYQNLSKEELFKFNEILEKISQRSDEPQRIGI